MGARGLARGRAGGGRNREELVNMDMARILDREPGWTVVPGQTRVVRGQLSRRLDIVVDVGDRAIVIETEFPPASGLNYDMDKAAGYDLRSLGVPIATVGVVLPPDTMQCGVDEIEGHLMAWVRSGGPAAWTRANGGRLLSQDIFCVGCWPSR